MIWSGLPSRLARVADLPRSFEKILKASKHTIASQSVVEVASLTKLSKFQIFSPPLYASEFRNDVMLDWDTYAASLRVNIDDYTAKSFSYNDQSPASGQLTFSVLQYCDCNPSIYDTQQKLREHYSSGFGSEDLEILQTFAVEYQPKWGIRDAAKGYHWDLYDYQGKNNLWIIGGGCSFDSTANVVGYNQLLLENMYW